MNERMGPDPTRRSTIERGRRTYTGPTTTTLTAAEVANLLRSSVRRGTTSRTQQTFRRSFVQDESRASTTSVENLVEAAAPINQDSMLEQPKDVSLVSNEQLEYDEKKTADGVDDSVSVI